MGRPPRWRRSPARAFGLACFAPAAAALRTARHRSLLCDVSDVQANTEPDISMSRPDLRQPSLCQPQLRQEWLQASTDCTVQEGPYDVRQALAPFWDGHGCPLTAEGLRRAATPAGHVGARLRLRRALLKLLQGEPLYVTVLGGSMTIGHQSLRSWPERLGDLFRKLKLPVFLVNHGQGGTTSRWVLANWNSLSPDFQRSDLILVDYGINDQGKNFDFRTLDGLGDQVVTGVYTDMLKMLLGLPNKPAVMDIETFKKVSVMTLTEQDEDGDLEIEEGWPWPGEHRRKEAPVEKCTDFNISTYRHWTVNRELDIPTVSYTEAVCSSGRTYWMREGEQQPDENELQHPGTVTHDLFARILRGVLLQEMEAVCTEGVLGSEYPADIADKVGNTIRCLATPTSYYHARLGYDAFKPLLSDNWFFEEDVPGKPGWIAHGGTVAEGGKMAIQRYGQLSFEVTTESGWLQVEFLSTYENIGFVSVWLDDKEPSDENSCRLDGFWLEHSSQSRFKLMQTGLPPGRHVLNFRAYGMKFKLLGIATC